MDTPQPGVAERAEAFVRDCLHSLFPAMSAADADLQHSNYSSASSYNYSSDHSTPASLNSDVGLDRPRRVSEHLQISSFTPVALSANTATQSSSISAVGARHSSATAAHQPSGTSWSTTATATTNPTTTSLAFPHSKPHRMLSTMDDGCSGGSGSGGGATFSPAKLAANVDFPIHTENQQLHLQRHANRALHRRAELGQRIDIVGQSDTVAVVHQSARNENRLHQAHSQQRERQSQGHSQAISQSASASSTGRSKGMMESLTSQLSWMLRRITSSPVPASASTSDSMSSQATVAIVAQKNADTLYLPRRSSSSTALALDAATVTTATAAIATMGNINDIVSRPIPRRMQFVMDDSQVANSLPSPLPTRYLDIAGSDSSTQGSEHVYESIHELLGFDLPAESTESNNVDSPSASTPQRRL